MFNYKTIASDLFDKGVRYDPDLKHYGMENIDRLLKRHNIECYGRAPLFVFEREIKRAMQKLGD